jgi:SagB-type dehydrogenase family enzyme
LRVDWSASTDKYLRPKSESALALLYHENSKLTEVLAGQQAEEFAASPFDLFVMSRGFRQFRDSPSVNLPPAKPAAVPIDEVMTRRRSRRDLMQACTSEALAGALQVALGPTAVIDNPDIGVSQVVRAWPSAGGLYPLDTYVLARDVTGLPSGVYHYNVVMSQLEVIPARPVADILRDGYFWQEFAVTASVAVLLVGVFERTISKYGERGYRLALLDAGHAAQNLLLAAEARDIRAVAVGGFCDDRLADDLGLDGISEAVIHSVLLGGCDDQVRP